MKILGVHGIGNHRPGETPREAAQNLALSWTTSLAAAGGDDHDVAVVYYADLVRRRGHQGEESELSDLTAGEEQMLRDVLAAQDLDPVGLSQGELTAWLRAGISALATTRLCSERLMEWLLVRFVKEAHAYLTPGPGRDAVQERFRTALRQHRPDILIAHSLGSVVAYETLHTSPGPNVPLWITIGSPLAFPRVIFNRLVPGPHDGRGTRPGCVGRWANLADPGDLFAIPVRGISQCFAGVESDNHAVIHAVDFHRAANYLKSPELRKLLG